MAEEVKEESSRIVTVGNLGGVNTQSRSVYLGNGLSPTLNAGMTHGNTIPYIVEVKEEVNQVDEIKVIGQMDNSIDHTHDDANRVYDENGISPTIQTYNGGNRQPKIIDCIAMRGRNPENPSDRTPGIELEQTLEINPEGIANTLTTVQKDNMVLIRQATKDGCVPCRIGGVADLTYPDSTTRRGRVIENGEVCPTLTTENIPSVLEDWIWEVDGQKYLIRIRKLTPKECWRLMDFSDEDFKKAQAVNSNTQLYKQAGNSIVKNVMCEVFKQLIDN